MDIQTHPHQSNPPIDLPAQAYRHLIHTLIALLPPPLVDTQEAILARNHAAIARIAALAPVNANEAELAAQCIATRAQAEDVMRLIRLHAGDITLVMKLNAQYAAMVRTSLAAHGHLLREQQQRRKREGTQTAADADEWTRHIAANTMLHALPIEPEAAAAPTGQPPETAPESHTVGDETSMRQSPSQPPKPANYLNRVIDLRPTASRPLNQGWQDGPADGNSGIAHHRRITH
ncbi:MAG TPA: hypothetical protein DDZ81_24395 [Acetobacteraceae bacterium]|jgi:hypothetical protein|nr:hypothetical protein [Acetobacteraceae bacterium]